MSRIRIWAVESDNDEKVVKELATKLANHLNLQVSIQTAGQKAYSRVARRTNRLEKAVEIFLKEADCLIFVLDFDSSLALQEKRRGKKTILKRIEEVAALGKFDGQIYIALAHPEIEAWLLIDCIGVCCYFAKTRYAKNCRERIIENKKFRRLIDRYQVGDTQEVVETTRGGQGAKEYLRQFSETILKTLNPQVKSSTIHQHRYDVEQSPKIAEYIEINEETLRRNNSLQRFGRYLAQCGAE